MIQSENLVLEHPEQKNSISKEQLLELKRQMNNKALAKRRARTGLRVTANLFGFCGAAASFICGEHCIYALRRTVYHGFEFSSQNPTFSNFKDAMTNVPLLRFILNSFIMAGCITLGQIVTCSLAAFAFSFLDFKERAYSL